MTLYNCKICYGQGQRCAKCKKKNKKITRKEFQENMDKEVKERKQKTLSI